MNYNSPSSHEEGTTATTSIPVIVIVAVLALLGGVVIVSTVVDILQQAEASCVTGYFHSGNKSALFTAFEKSEARCFSHP